MSTYLWTQSAALVGMAFAVVTGATISLYVVTRYFAAATRRVRRLAGLATWGISFQVIHCAEHVIQFGYWVGHPKEKPYVTPWASEAAEGLAFWCRTWPGTGQGPARGIELLHLFGNGIFLVGLASLALLMRDRGVPFGGSRILRWAFWLQAFHVVEHIMLTTSFFTTGTARGFSTMFGLVDPGGAFVVNYRLTWHFAMNVLVTVLALWAGRDLARAGHLTFERPNPERTVGVGGASAVGAAPSHS